MTHATPPTPRPEGPPKDAVIIREGGAWPTCCYCGKPIENEEPIYHGLVSGKIADYRHKGCPAPVARDLPALIESARAHVMTPEEREAQRQSFAAGNVGEEREGERRTVVRKPDTAKPRYSVGVGGVNEPGLILICDHERHQIIARSSEVALPLVQALVDRANGASVIDDLRRRLALAETRAGDLVKAGDALVSLINHQRMYRKDDFTRTAISHLDNWDAAKAGGGA